MTETLAALLLAHVLADFVFQTRWIVQNKRRPSVLLLPVSYTHLRAHETVLDLVCRLLLEKKKKYSTAHLQLS